MVTLQNEHMRKKFCFPDANDISHSKNGRELKELNKQMETEYEKLQQRAENNVEIIIKNTALVLHSHSNSLKLFYLSMVVELKVATKQFIDKFNHVIEPGCLYLEYTIKKPRKKGLRLVRNFNLNFLFILLGYS